MPSEHRPRCSCFVICFKSHAHASHHSPAILISVGLQGPRGEGSVQVDAHAGMDRWTYQTLTFAGIDGDQIMVLRPQHRHRSLPAMT